MFYSDYETKTFAEIFADQDTFKAAVPSVLSDKLVGLDLDLIYFLLNSRYGNSHIVNQDQAQFVNKLFSLIYQYGPTWSRKTSIQETLRQMSEDELLTGAKTIYNHAFNPSTEPTTDTLDELTYINDQNATKYKKSKVDAYAMLYEVLSEDITEEFLGRFKRLFATIIIPRPIWEDINNE